MKNHRFPWLRNRTTDNRKCEKACNIKEKRTIEMFSTVSKALVAHRSSARDKNLSCYINPGRFLFRGFVYNCGVLAAQLLRSQTKNSPQDCFLNAATVQQEIKFQNFSKFGRYAFGLCFLLPRQFSKR